MESNKFKHLSTRLWKLTDGSTFAQEDVADAFRDGIGPLLNKEPGFLKHGGAIALGTDQMFFFNVFDMESQAVVATAAEDLLKWQAMLEFLGMPNHWSRDKSKFENSDH